MTRYFAAFAVLVLLAGLAGPAFAQKANKKLPPAAAGSTGAVSGTLEAPKEKKPTTAPPPESTADKNAPFRRSFFFSQTDLLDIDRALRGIATTGGVLGEATNGIIPQVRKLSLEGIFYKSPQEWMIWLNKQKVTPWVQPREVKEIIVEPNVVHLKWFDIGANGVISLDMRPNEVYDIVTGVTLPDQTQVKNEKAVKGGRKK